MRQDLAPRMCQGRDISELLEAGDHAGAAQKFLELGLIAEGVDPLAYGGGNVAKAGFQYVEDRLLAAFLTPLLAALFSGESFEAGDVGHGIGVLESIDLFSQGDNKLLGQRHQPVDQAQQVPCLEFGVALAAELASELEAVFVEVFGFLAVFLGAEVGGDDEDRLVIAVARGVEPVLEIINLANGEADTQAVVAEATRVPGGSPVAAVVAEDHEGQDGDVVATVDAAAVVEEASRQLGIVLHLDFNVDEQPLVAAVDEAHLDQFVGAQGSVVSVGNDFAEFLLERNGLNRPVDAPGDLWEGEFEEGLQEPVEGFLPRTVVIERIVHFPSFRSVPSGPFMKSFGRLGSDPCLRGVGGDGNSPAPPRGVRRMPVG